jgi:hypothetical protein
MSRVAIVVSDSMKRFARQLIFLICFRNFFTLLTFFCRTDALRRPDFWSAVQVVTVPTRNYLSTDDGVRGRTIFRIVNIRKNSFYRSNVLSTTNVRTLVRSLFLLADCTLLNCTRFG